MELAYTNKNKSDFAKNFLSTLGGHNRYLTGDGEVHETEGGFITYEFPSGTKPLSKTNEEIINGFLGVLDLDNYNIHPVITFKKSKYYVKLIPRGGGPLGSHN